jgi:hypothetical protein
MVFFPQVSPPKPCRCLSSPPYVPHALPTSVFLIWSPKYLARSTQHKAPHYVVFSVPVTLSLLGPNILLSTVSLNVLILRSSFNVSDQVSHPYKTTGEIIVLCILIFTFADSKLKT